MQHLYDAANGLEAHMLRDLLQQDGIKAYIHGEALQGAIGEMPAAGLVRLVVDEKDHARARTLIERWEQTQIEEPSHSGAPSPTRPSSGAWRFALGFAVGAILVYAAYKTPVTSDGIDYNRDGVLDERWTYSPNGSILKTEADRNLDSKTDYVIHYDSRGLIESAQADDDFDGIFESRLQFQLGNLRSMDSDTDADGVMDLRWIYENGVLLRIEHLDLASSLPFRVEHYQLGKLTHADIDIDRDGILDTRVHYSSLAEETSREIIPR